MEFSLPEEVTTYKKEAREWVQNVLDPLSVPLEEEERLPSELVDELRRGRFFGLTIPKEYGGQGWSAVQWFTVLEELAKAYATVRLIAHTMNGLFWRPLLYFGTEDQKKKYLPKLASGEIWAANSLTEPEAGTGRDINSKATRDGDSVRTQWQEVAHYPFPRAYEAYLRLCRHRRGCYLISRGCPHRWFEPQADGKDDGLRGSSALQCDLRQLPCACFKYIGSEGRRARRCFRHAASQ